MTNKLKIGIFALAIAFGTTSAMAVSQEQALPPCPTTNQEELDDRCKTPMSPQCCEFTQNVIINEVEYQIGDVYHGTWDPNP